MTETTLEIAIKGSTGSLYVVTFSRSANTLKATCTCAAGQKGKHCKHRLGLLKGDLTAISGTTPTGLEEKFQQMLDGTQLKLVLQEYWDAESQYSKATDRRKKAHQRLDIAMRT